MVLVFTQKKKGVGSESSVEPCWEPWWVSQCIYKWENLRSWMEKMCLSPTPSPKNQEKILLSHLSRQGSLHTMGCCPGYVTGCEAVSSSYHWYKWKSWVFPELKPASESFSPDHQAIFSLTSPFLTYHFEGEIKSSDLKTNLHAKKVDGLTYLFQSSSDQWVPEKAPSYLPLILALFFPPTFLLLFYGKC